MKLRILGVLALAALAGACDEPLDPTPQQAIPSEEALDTPDEVRVAVNAMYDALQDCDGGYCRDLVIFPDMYAGDLAFTGTYASDREVGRATLTSANTALPGIWGTAYRGINRANNVLASLPALQDEFDDESEYDQLKGEAHFIRALNYFNLVNFFGGVPLVTQPISQVPADVGQTRNSAAEVFAFVESELAAARAGLPELGSDAQGRASYEAATALLARVHLYQREWQQAYNLADEVIDSGHFSLEPQYENVFEKEQTGEAIMEVPFTVTDPGSLAFWFFPGSLGGRRGFAPSASSIGGVTGFRNSFESGDRRRAVAVRFTGGGTAYGYKYTDIASTADDVPILRLAEMYLIRSEAAARLGGRLPEAIADLNVIRNRAGLANLPASVDTQVEVLAANLDERRHELFYEGHRFFDLKRFADAVPAAQAVLTARGITGNRLLFPVPQREIDANPKLTQNPGY
jgi:hypothetical protein